MLKFTKKDMIFTIEFGTRLEVEKLLECYTRRFNKSNSN